MIASKYDCFIGVMMYVLDKLNARELINPILGRTYGFYYNKEWKNLDDDIVYTYIERDILNELASFGVGLYEEDISILELNHKKIEEDEIVTGIIDGYYCLWHSAYKSYHVNHHIVFLEAFDNKIEVLDPFFNCNKYYIEYDQNMHIMIFKEGYNERKNIINNSNFAHRFSLCTLKIQCLAVIQLSKFRCYAA